jgi:hypothetical protein
MPVLRALSRRISIHALEYSLTISPLYGSPWWSIFYRSGGKSYRRIGAGSLLWCSRGPPRADHPVLHWTHFGDWRYGWADSGAPGKRVALPPFHGEQFSHRTPVHVTKTFITKSTSRPESRAHRSARHKASTGVITFDIACTARRAGARPLARTRGSRASQLHSRTIR